MRSLGLNGRFGNQILQYGFLKIYASAHNLLAETPEWIGRYIFNLKDPYISGALPGFKENEDLFIRSLNREIVETLADHDIWGYCCYHTRAISRYRDYFRSLYAFSQTVRPVLENALTSLGKRGRTLVVLHLRRADFGAGKFWIAPEDWYVKWLESIWSDLDNPVLYIASDDPMAVLPVFEAYNPVIATDVGDLIPGIEFMHDFHLMTQADYLAISNSTFSFTASMINQKAKCFLRPDRARHQLVEYDPWNADVLLE